MSLAVGRVVLVAGLLVFQALEGVLVPRVLVVLGELSVRVFFALALVVVLRVRKRVRIVWSVLVLLSAAFCCSCFRAAPPLVAIVFASLFFAWSHQASWAGPHPMH